MSIPVLNNFVDSVGAYLNESQARHFTAWPILGAYTWPNPSPIPTSYAGELTAIKAWISSRISWMDANLPGTCNVGITESILTENSVSVYPNPFSTSFNVSFYLPNSQLLDIKVVDILGKLVKQIDRKEYTEGENNIEFNFGNEIQKGMYLITIATKDGIVVKKLTKME